MSTVTLSTTPTALDPGTAYELDVVNTSSVTVFLTMDGGALGRIFDERLRPGQSLRVSPHGYALNGYVQTGSGSVDVTVLTNPQGDPDNEASDAKQSDLTAAIAAEVARTGGTYAPRSSVPSTITYNADGTVATVTEADTGAVVTYTYNADGTPATEARLLGGVTTTRTFTYVGGNLTAVA